MSQPEDKLSFWERQFPTFLGVTRMSQARPIQLELDITYRLLKRIENRRPTEGIEGDGENPRRSWLMRSRRELRRIDAYGRVGVIQLYMRECPAEMRPVCVWLIGRNVHRSRLFGLARLADDPSPQIRWHVAKALRRARAWPALAQMAARYPEDARFKWMSIPHVEGRRSFVDRLSSYKSRLDDSHADGVVTPSRMPFWALERTWEYSPPKSVHVIRRMLRRIRHWVRWGVTEM